MSSQTKPKPLDYWTGKLASVEKTGVPRPASQLVLCLLVGIIAVWFNNITFERRLVNRPNYPEIFWPGLHFFGWIIAFTIIARLLYPFYQSLARRRAALLIPAAPTRREWIGWYGLGLLFIAYALTRLELHDSYYFTRDDMLSQWLPVFTLGMRQIFEGHFPCWNPYQFGGAPSGVTGLYGFTYPPLIVAYAVARFVLHNENAVADVNAAIHLALGYSTVFWMCRSAGMRPAWSTTAGLCCALSGAVLIIGRCWGDVTFVPLVYEPLLIVALLRWKRGSVGGWWVLGTGLVMGLLYYGVFLQLFVYGIAFFLFGAVAMVVLGEVPWKRLLWMLPPLLLGAALSLPLAVPAISVLTNLTRGRPSGEGVEPGLPAMMLPYPLTTGEITPQHPLSAFEQLRLWCGLVGPEPDGMGAVMPAHVSNFYYFGTIFTLVFFLLVGSLFAFDNARATLRKNPWIIPAAWALLMSLGHAGVLQPLLAKVPLLSTNANYPKRYYLYFEIFAVLAAGLAIAQASAQLRIKPWIGGLVALLPCLAMLWCASHCDSSYCNYGFKPYPPLAKEMDLMLHNSDDAQRCRIIAVGPFRSAEPDYPLAMLESMPTQYRILSLDGYDPAVIGLRETRLVYTVITNPAGKTDEEKAINLLAMYRFFGVHYVVCYKIPPGMVAEAPPWIPAALSAIQQQGFPIREYAIPGHLKLRVFEVPHPAKMAFTESDPDTGLPLKLTASGFEVDTSNVTGAADLIVNFIARPQWTAAADGHPTDCTMDGYVRIKIHVPAGAQKITGTFSVPWAFGFQLGAVFLLAAGLLTRFLPRLDGTAV